MLGSPILYLKGMKILMFQLSGFYYKVRSSDSLLSLPLPSREACKVAQLFLRNDRGSFSFPTEPCGF